MTLAHFSGLISCYASPFIGYLSNDQSLTTLCLAYSWYSQYICSVFVNMFTGKKGENG